MSEKGNKLMQDFMRDQCRNEISYNIPQLLYQGTYNIKWFMLWSLAADFFDESLETINTLIQGPNIENLNFSKENFGIVCSSVLELYK